MTNLQENIGVFTNPKHDLYVGPCEPQADSLEHQCGHDDVVLHIRATGICGSDVHFQKHGAVGKTMVVRDEHILGHESSAEVIHVGSGVTHLKKGDRVAVEPGLGCGVCDECRTGKYNGCPEMAFKSTPPVPGLLRRYVVHPASLCHKIGDMSFEEGAMLEPVSVALYGIEESGVRLADPVLVCGAGPIGVISAILARAAGAAPLVITDIDQGRLDFAAKMVPGIRTVKVEPKLDAEAMAEKVIAAAGGIKLRVCLECTGVESSMAVGIYSLAFGGVAHVIGAGKDFQQIPFMHLSVNEMTLKFQYRYNNTWPKGIRLINEGLINVKPLVTHKFKLQDSAKAFETSCDVSSGSVKVMIFDE